MNVTSREFRIGAVSGLLGFLVCYFLFGDLQPPRAPAQMTIVAPLSNATSHALSAPEKGRGQLNITNRTLVTVGGSYAIKARPELLEPPPRPRIDLTSSRYRAEVDLSDLQ